MEEKDKLAEELSDDALEQAAGGVILINDEQTAVIVCESCGGRNFRAVGRLPEKPGYAQYQCTACSRIMDIEDSL